MNTNNIYDQVRLWIYATEKLARENNADHPYEALFEYFKSEAEKVLWLTEKNKVAITEANTIYAVLNILDKRQQQELLTALEWNPESAFLKFMWDKCKKD